MKKKQLNNRLLLNKKTISNLKGEVKGGANNNNNNTNGCDEHSNARNCNESLDGINCGFYSRYYCLTVICD